MDYDSAPLAPGATRTLTLRFLPTTTGFASGLITLNSNDPDAESAFTFPVTGTGLDVTAPVLTEVGISSNNPNPIYATSGNTVSVSFTTNEPVQTPVVQIAQASGITITGGPTAWVASGTIDTLGAAPPEGPLVFHITPTDLAGNLGAEVSTVTDSSEITVDRTAPAFPAVSDVLAQEVVGTGGAMVNFTVSAPATDLHGIDHMTYAPASGSFFPIGANLVIATAYDPAGNAGTTQFFVNVNAKPVAVADVIHGPAKTAGAFTISPLANDTDAFGGALTLVSTSGSDFANVTVVGNDLVYERNTTGDGNDTLTYTITDGLGGTATGTITLVNEAPVVVDWATAVGEDTENSMLSATYSDPEGDPLTFTVVTQPAHGTVTVSNQFFVYTPTPNYFGPDSFTYQATDDRGAMSNVATLSIEVSSVNDAPVVTNQTATTNEDMSVNIPLNGTDVENQTLAYMIQRQPGSGTVSITGGVATYTPAANFSGTDSFAFSADDGQSQNHSSQAAEVFITVEPINDDQDIALETVEAGPVITGGYLSLGEQDVNAGARLVTVTIRNTGTDPLSGISAAVFDHFGAPSTGPFTLHTAPPVTIPAGGSGTLMLAFDPDSSSSDLLGYSLHQGTLVVTSNDPDEGSYLVNLSGNGLHPSLAVDVATFDIIGIPYNGVYTHDFGRVQTGGSIGATVRVRNTGPGLLTGSINFGGAPGYSITGAGHVLARHGRLAGLRRDVYSHHGGERHPIFFPSTPTTRSVAWRVSVSQAVETPAH